MTDTNTNRNTDANTNRNTDTDAAFDAKIADMYRAQDQDRDTEYTGLTIRDLPDCLLLVPEISKRGGLHYVRLDETNIETGDKSVKVHAETLKIIDDEEEHTKATALVTRWKYRLGKLGHRVANGIVVNRTKRDLVKAEIEEGRAEFEEFNARALTCRVVFNAWLFDVAGDNAANLQSLLDDMDDRLAELQEAMENFDPKGIRDCLKKTKGFVDLLPGEVAERMQAARDTARAKAKDLGGQERKISRLEKKLAEELGTDDPAAFAERIDSLLAGPLTEERARRATRLTKMIEERDSTVDALEVTKQRIDTSPIRLARIAIVGDRNMSTASETPRGSVTDTRRFGIMQSETETVETETPETVETETPETVETDTVETETPETVETETVETETPETVETETVETETSDTVETETSETETSETETVETSETETVETPETETVETSETETVETPETETVETETVETETPETETPETETRRGEGLTAAARARFSRLGGGLAL